MKALIIDDPDNVKNSENLNNILNNGELREIGNKMCYIHSSNKSPRKIAEEIKDKYSDYLSTNNEDEKDSLLLFINIEGKFGYKCWRQSQAGVELLMWLRCKHKICNPIILYSFQSNQQLLKQKPENLIINSYGCYHYQLPVDFSKIVEKINKNNFKGVKDWYNLKNFLKPAVNLEVFRHRDANWWGVKCLWDVHKLIDTKWGNSKHGEYPPVLKEKLNDLNNVVAEFCYSFGNEKLNDVINDIKESTIKDLEEINNKLDKCKNEISEFSKSLSYLKDENVDLNNKIYIYNENASKDKINASFYFTEIRKIKEELNTCEDLINEAKTELKIKNEDLKSFGILESDLKKARSNIYECSRKYYSIFINNIEILRSSLLENNSKFKVLYIDDKANAGWKDILCKILNMGDNLTCITPEIEFKEKIDELYISVKQKYLNETDKPDVIFLDLRLFDETDLLIEENNKISGVILLEKIKTDFPGIPIIILTASNKMWNYELVIKLGADAYWIKEGLDNHFTPNESIRNYQRLLKIISILTGNEYRFFGKFIKKVEVIENKLNNNQLYEGRKTKLLEFVNDDFRKKEFIKLLKNSTYLFRSFLSNNIMNNHFFMEDNTLSLKSNSELCNIINKLGNLIELIHFKGKYEQNMTQTLKERGDFTALLILKFRNISSHYNESRDVTFDSFKIFCKLVMFWLENNFSTYKKNFDDLNNLNVDTLNKAINCYIEQSYYAKKYFSDFD